MSGAHSILGIWNEFVLIEPRLRESWPEVPHGGQNPTGVFEFCANLNPFGPSPKVIQAIREARFDHYPDRHARELTKILANQFGVCADEVLVGNGCSELIDLVARAYIRSGDSAVILGPTYGEYARSIQVYGGRRRVASSLEALQAAPQMEDRVCFVCNPNNPTGEFIPIEKLATLAKQRPGTLLVVDEAYGACVPGFVSASIRKLPNVLTLHSLTKAHGLAGLRLGYAIGPRAIVANLRQVQIPWSVNTLAQAAGIAALRDPTYTEQTVIAWQTLRDQLVQELRSLGLLLQVASTPYFLIEVGDGQLWRERLLRRCISVRDTRSFGLPTFVRISPSLEGNNQRLVAAVTAELSQ